MLNLTQNGQVISQIYPGAWFALPDGRRVSPAYDGWTMEGYALVPAVIPEPSKEQQEFSRRIDYQQEADPLFFMAQRGEATMEEWTAKIAEIKARYPYPSE